MERKTKRSPGNVQQKSEPAIKASQERDLSIADCPKCPEVVRPGASASMLLVPVWTLKDRLDLARLHDMDTSNLFLHQRWNNKSLICNSWLCTQSAGDKKYEE